MISSNVQKIEGIVKSKKFYDDNSGFHILSVLLPNDKKIIVKGICPIAVKINDCIEAEGHIARSKYGDELKVKVLSVIKPTKIDTIRTYLTSGIIKGLTKKNGNDLVDAWGINSIKIIDENPEMLLKIKGIGESKLQKIMDSWEKIKPTEQSVNEIMALGYNEVEAVSIVQRFGERSLDVIKNSPYIIHKRVTKIEFEKVDDVALSMGIPKNDQSRILSAIIHFLNLEHDSGECIIPYDYFFSKCLRYLKVKAEDLVEQFTYGISNQYFFYYEKKEVDFAHSTSEETVYVIKPYIQHAKVRKTEKEIARRLLLINSSTAHKLEKDDVYELKDIKRKGEVKIPLSDEQKEAVFKSINAKVAIITGGPGTGKTTVLNEVLKQLVKGLGKSVYLCAPTGKAAQRMKESTGLKASTIHRLLDFHPMEKRFRVNESNPLKTDVIVIDEASMIDIYVMAHLLRAIDNDTQIIIVGDVNQLASVQAGSVLRDLINSGLFVTSSLTQIFRQAAESKIITNAHAVNDGIFDFEYIPTEGDDFFFIESNNDGKTYKLIENIIKNKIKQTYNLDPKNDVQLLVPQHKGVLGTINLNNKMQVLLNENESNGLKTDIFEFKKGDKVIQIINNYDKSVFNGDCGKITIVNEKGVSVKFDGITEEIEYNTNELDEIMPSYALSIHKSQGSEYPFVIIPLPEEYNPIMDRSLVYTGITRGKKIVVIIGKKEILRKAILTQTSRFRKTNLKESMNDLFNSKEILQLAS